MAQMMLQHDIESYVAYPSPRSLPSTPQPVFVIGSMRSGASLLALSLAQHHAVVPAAETGWLERFAMSLHQTFEDVSASSAHPPIASALFDRDRFIASFGDSASRLQVGDRLATRWVDSTYTNAFLAAPLAQLFPRGRFIHVLRDVDSVVASLTSAENRRSYRSQHRQLEVRDAYEHWMDVVTACVEVEQCLGSDLVLRIRRDDLVREPEQTLRRCFDFIGESFEPEALRPFSGLDETALTGRPLDLPINEPWRIQADVLSRSLLAEPRPSYPADATWRARLDAAFLRRCAATQR